MGSYVMTEQLFEITDGFFSLTCCLDGSIPCKRLPNIVLLLYWVFSFLRVGTNGHKTTTNYLGSVVILYTLECLFLAYYS